MERASTNCFEDYFDALSRVFCCKNDREDPIGPIAIVALVVTAPLLVIPMAALWGASSLIGRVWQRATRSDIDERADSAASEVLGSDQILSPSIQGSSPSGSFGDSQDSFGPPEPLPPVSAFSFGPYPLEPNFRPTVGYLLPRREAGLTKEQVNFLIGKAEEFLQETEERRLIDFFFKCFQDHRFVENPKEYLEGLYRESLKDFAAVSPEEEETKRVIQQVIGFYQDLLPLKTSEDAPLTENQREFILAAARDVFVNNPTQIEGVSGWINNKEFQARPAAALKFLIGALNSGEFDQWPLGPTLECFEFLHQFFYNKPIDLKKNP